MFTAQHLENYADVLLWGLSISRRENYKPGNIVLLRYDPPAQPLAEAVYAKLLDMGLHPVVRTNLSAAMEQSFYSLSSYGQLTFQPPGDMELMERVHGVVSLLAPEALTHLAQVNPADIATSQLARKPLRDVMQRREEEGGLGWSLCLWPTQALANSAGLTLEDYTAQIVRACHLDKSQPRHDWAQFWRQIGEIKSWLTSMDICLLRLESAQCDLTLTLGKERRFIGLTGHNIPSFEVYVSPDYRGTSGVYYADLPSYRSGNLVRGVRLEFQNGNVTRVSAEAGADFVRRQVAMDPGAARVGEFSLTDKRFSRIDRFMAHTLFDENFGGPHGNCHIALGASYSATYAGDPASLSPEVKTELGFNSSALHWDLVNTEDKRVVAVLRDGTSRTIYEQGQFTY